MAKKPDIYKLDNVAERVIKALKVKLSKELERAINNKKHFCYKDIHKRYILIYTPEVVIDESFCRPAFWAYIKCSINSETVEPNDNVHYLDNQESTEAMASKVIDNIMYDTRFLMPEL